MNVFKQYQQIALTIKDVSHCNSKWSPIFKKRIKIDRKDINEKISLFLEVYSQILNAISATLPYGYANLQFNPYQPAQTLPNGFFDLSKALEYIISTLDDFILNDNSTKIDIKSEYYNALTGKKGLLLVNGQRIEDGQFLDNKCMETINKKLIKVVDNSIEYLLRPDMRKNMDRKKKLNRII